MDKRWIFILALSMASRITWGHPPPNMRPPGHHGPPHMEPPGHYHGPPGHYHGSPGHHHGPPGHHHGPPHHHHGPPHHHDWSDEWDSSDEDSSEWDGSGPDSGPDDSHEYGNHHNHHHHHPKPPPPRPGQPGPSMPPPRPGYPRPNPPPGPYPGQPNPQPGMFPQPNPNLQPGPFPQPNPNPQPFPNIPPEPQPNRDRPPRPNPGRYPKPPRPNPNPSPTPNPPPRPNPMPNPNPGPFPRPNPNPLPQPNPQPDVQNCIRNCPVTPEFNPVCGTDGITYNNIGRLECARRCGMNVALLRSSRCPTNGLSTESPTISSTPAGNVQACISTCPVTSEYNPVCGSDGVTYANPGRLECAKMCGVNVLLSRSSRCPANQPATQSPITNPGNGPNPAVTPWPLPSSTNGGDVTVSKDVLDQIFKSTTEPDTTGLIDIRQLNDN